MRALAMLASALAIGCAVAPCDPSLGLEPEECEEVRALRLPASLPPARGNAHAEDEIAAELGFHLFFDRDLGAGVACASCHAPELTFTDRMPVSIGKGTGTRNAPTTLNAARLSVFLWDGHADSLWSQPLFAVESPLEMGSSRLALAHVIASDPELRSRYEAVFGSLDVDDLPASGAPGDPAYDALDEAQQGDVDRIAANAGKAFEAYLRRSTGGEAELDGYLDGDFGRLNPVARDGLRAFVRVGCIDCHRGPMLTDELFHAGTLVDDGDPGRYDGIAIVRANRFNLAGPYADENEASLPAPATEADRGAFRTPSLRNVASTHPYGHDGSLASLGDVLDLHAPALGAEDRGALLAFLQTLDGDYPPRPWSTWPQPQ